MAKPSIKARTEKRAKFNVTFFDVGVPKYEVGKHYPLNEETEREIAKGNAELIEVTDDTPEDTDGDAE